MEHLVKLYVAERERFVIMAADGIYIPKIKARYMILADSNLTKHILQKYTVSVFGSKQGSKFLCFDVDEGGIEKVVELRTAIENTGVDRADIHISYSGSKGYHVELFFDELVSHACLLMFFRSVTGAMETDTSKIECRPTQYQSIKLPLSVHPKSGKMCWFLEQGSLQEIRSYDYLFGINPMNAQAFTELTYALTEELPVQDAEFEEACQSFLSDAGYTISGNNLPAITQIGTRHSLTVKMATALRGRGLPAEACREILLHWMSLQNPNHYSTPQREVYTDIDRIIKWTYRTPAFHASDEWEVIGSISRGDMQQLMARRWRSERRLYFLLLINRLYRKALRQDEMADMLNLAPNGITRLISRLTKDGELVQDHGSVYIVEKVFFYKERSRYDIIRKPLSKEHEAHWKTDLLFHSFPLPRTREDLTKVYFGSIQAMFGGYDMKSRMTPTEYGEYLAYLEEQKQDSTETNTGAACSIT